jgi:hypothetical protein
LGDGSFAPTGTFGFGGSTMSIGFFSIGFAACSAEGWRSPRNRRGTKMPAATMAIIATPPRRSRLRDHIGSGGADSPRGTAIDLGFPGEVRFIAIVNFVPQRGQVALRPSASEGAFNRAPHCVQTATDIRWSPPMKRPRHSRRFAGNGKGEKDRPPFSLTFARLAGRETLAIGFGNNSTRIGERRCPRFPKVTIG